MASAISSLVLVSKAPGATTADFASVVDPDATDMDVHHRTGEWYRRRLNEHFTQAGAGLWVRKGGGVALYELERSR